MHALESSVWDQPSLNPSCVRESQIQCPLGKEENGTHSDHSIQLLLFAGFQKLIGFLVVNTKTHTMKLQRGKLAQDVLTNVKLHLGPIAAACEAKVDGGEISA